MGRSYDIVETSALGEWPHDYEPGRAYTSGADDDFIYRVVQVEDNTYNCLTGVDASSNKSWADVEDNFVEWLPGAMQGSTIWDETNTAVIQNYLNWSEVPSGSSYDPEMYYDIYTSEPQNEKENETYRRVSTCLWRTSGAYVYTAIYFNGNRDDEQNVCIEYTSASGCMEYAAATSIANTQHNYGSNKPISALGMPVSSAKGDNRYDEFYCGILPDRLRLTDIRRYERTISESSSYYNWFALPSLDNSIYFSPIQKVTGYKHDNLNKPIKLQVSFGYDGSVSSHFISLDEQKSGSGYDFDKNLSTNYDNWAGGLINDIYSPYTPSFRSDTFNFLINMALTSKQWGGSGASGFPGNGAVDWNSFSDKKIVGNIGCLVENVISDGKDASESPRTHISIKTDTPALFLNTDSSSYYVRSRVNVSGIGSSCQDVYIPSLRFSYEYGGGTNQFCGRFVFNGYKPIPIDTSDASKDVKSVIEENEANNTWVPDYTEDENDGPDTTPDGTVEPGSDPEDDEPDDAMTNFGDGDGAADNTSTIDPTLEKGVTFDEWPAVRLDDSTHSLYDGGCCTKSEDGNWIACLKNFDIWKTKIDKWGGYNSIIKSADFYYFRIRDDEDGSDPYVLPQTHMDDGYGVFQQKCKNSVIKPPASSLGTNLRSITGLSMNQLVESDGGVSQYAFTYKFNNGGECPACNGILGLQRYPGINAVTAVYEDGSTNTVSIDTTNHYYGIPLSNDVGRALRTLNVNHGGNTFEVYRTVNSYANMMMDPLYSNTVRSSIKDFFEDYTSDAKLWDTNVYFKGGIFDSLKVVRASSDVGSLRDGDGNYVIYDGVFFDVEIQPKLSDAQKTVFNNLFSGYTDERIAEMISAGVVGKWYIWIDRSSNSVPSNIKLEIMDCMAKKVDDGEWVHYDLDDVTDKLVSSDGKKYVLPTNAEPFAVNSSDFPAHRLKVRFRLYANSNSLYLNDSGYRVVLSYRVEGRYGNKHFNVCERQMNPYQRICDTVKSSDGRVGTNRSYKVFIGGKCDLENPRGGMVYGNTSISTSDIDVAMDATFYDGDNGPETVGRLVNNWGTGSITKNIYDINSVESGTSDSSTEVGKYYAVVKWNELFPDYSIKVVHSVGSYYNHLSDYSFNLESDVSIKFGNLYVWDGNTKYYKPSPSTSYDKTLDSDKSYYNNTNNESLQIFKLWAEGEERAYGLRVQSTSASSHGYNIAVGSITNPVIILDDGDVNDTIKIDPDMFEIDDRGEQFLRIFITKDSKGLELPSTYITYTPGDDDKLLYSRGYYPMYGGLSIRFKDFENIAVKCTTSTSPAKPSGDDGFYIVNGFKVFNVEATYRVAGSSSGDNAIVYGDIRTSWQIQCFKKEGNTSTLFWDSGSNYMFSLNNNKAKFMIGVSRDNTGVGILPYDPYDWILRCTGEATIPYTIKVDGYTVGSGVQIIKDIGPLNFDPVRVVVEPQMFFMNPVIGYHDNAVLINETDNSRNIYTKYDIDMNCGIAWHDVASTVKTIVTPMNFSYDMDTVGSVKGHLSNAWKSNDEKLEYITSINHPFLFVVNKEAYQENVTRVVDGQKLKYPYSRNDVLMPPNEWLTAENMNRRFDMIDENLKYLAGQTRVYSKPPIRYCGYYGDFQANINGAYSRSCGYVPVVDTALYGKYNELTSIDDEKTVFRGIKSICVDVEDYDVMPVTATGDKGYQIYQQKCANNNMYVCLGDKIKVFNTLTYTQSLFREDMVPKNVNEFMDDISVISYSNDTGFLYFLSTKTHKVYIFHQYDNSLGRDLQNAAYYGEIGGYGGPYVTNKFNNPTDLFISTVIEDSKTAYDEEEIVEDDVVDGEEQEDEEESETDASDGVKKHDEMWVCDTGNNVIKHYTIKGQWINTIDLNSLEGFNVISVCTDYKNRVFVLTGTHVFVFSAKGNLKYIFELREKLGKPKLIRSQHNAEFVYVLYEHFVEKYNSAGEYIGKFAENDGLTYTSMYADRKHNLYIATNKNILHYCDGLHVMELGQTENADRFKWKMDEIYLKRDENIQDSVLNTSLQRMYDNIQMYCMCILSHVVDAVSDENESRIYDIDYVVRDKLKEMFHKDRAFVGINELVTCDVINRSFGLMYDLLETILAAI